MKKSHILLMFMVVGILTSAMFVFATRQGAQTSMISTGRYTSSATGFEASQGGNVSMVNVSGTLSTDKWQGYYGNATGSLLLGLGNSIFYTFSGASAQAVYKICNCLNLITSYL